MKRVRTWQLCRTGTFGTDGATITHNDLEEIIQTFAPPRPISIGHDMARADNFPKFGDVLAIDGIYPDAKHPGQEVLVGKVVLHPELEKQFDDKANGNGTFEGWSVTIPRRASDGKRYLHSLAICGATPPKIPGLEQLMIKSCYSDGDTVEVYDFSDSVEYKEESSMTEEEKKKMADLEAENKNCLDLPFSEGDTPESFYRKSLKISRILHLNLAKTNQKLAHFLLSPLHHTHCLDLPFSEGDTPYGSLSLSRLGIGTVCQA